MVGTQDILTPMGDSEELAERIPGAELVLVRGAAHGFMLEQGAAFNRAALDFLDRASSSDRRLRPDEARLQPEPGPASNGSGGVGRSVRRAPIS